MEGKLVNTGVRFIMYVHLKSSSFLFEFLNFGVDLGQRGHGKSKSKSDATCIWLWFGLEKEGVR